MKNNIKNLILAALTVFAFFLNLEGIYYNEINGINIFATNLMIVTVIFLLLFSFYKCFQKEKISKTEMVLCIFFTIFSLLGNSYQKISSWDLVFGNFLMFIISIFSGVGYYSLFKNVFSLLHKLLKKEPFINIKIKNRYLKKILSIFEKHPFLVSFIIIIACWLIYIVAFYPIILSPDPAFQIKQFFNEHTKYIDWVIQVDKNVNMTTHHPVIHTVLLGGCIKLGSLILNDNFGLFIYSLIQIICLASVLSYTIVFSKKHQVPIWFRVILLLIYSLVPMFPLYAMSGVKDTYYTIFMILYILFLYDFVTLYRNKKISWKYSLYITVVIVLIALFRNNGFYVVILSFPLLFIYSRKNIFKLLLIFTIFIGSYELYNKVIIPSFKISEGSIREVLSIPFQQTARYVKYHEEDLSKEEIEIIDNMLGYEDLATRYDPEKADPVKNMYNKYTTSEDLKNYFTKVWWKGLLKHPTTYIEATLNNVYGYFYPNSLKWYVYYKYDNRITENDLVDYHYNSLSGIRKVLSSYAVSFPYIPVIGLCSNIGFNTWVVFILGSFYIDNHKKKYLLVLSPILVSILVCIASPVNTYFRYAMPYVFVIPVLIGLTINLLKKKN